jgi:hypothetical protein
LDFAGRLFLPGLAAKVGGVDILPLLGNDLIGQIEEGAIWSQD